VEKVTEDMWLNQRRIELVVDRRNCCILDVREGSLPVFGWDPKLVVGKGLQEVLDVFDQWERSSSSRSEKVSSSSSSAMLLQLMVER
jgi:hypothetical protein